MATFWRLLESSVILSGLVALSLVFTTCYLAIMGEDVPDVIQAALMAVVGFFFGSRKKQDESGTG